MNSRKLLLLSTLASLGLLACTSQPGQLDLADDDALGEVHDDLLRFEVEVVGEGELMVLEPYVEPCNTEDGICSFVFERGTRVVFDSGSAKLSETTPLQCSERGLCSLLLGEDTSVLADFEALGPSGVERHFGFLPGEPWFVIDPCLGNCDSNQPTALDQGLSISAD